MFKVGDIRKRNSKKRVSTRGKCNHTNLNPYIGVYPLP